MIRADRLFSYQRVVCVCLSGNPGIFRFLTVEIDSLAGWRPVWLNWSAAEMQRGLEGSRIRVSDINIKLSYPLMHAEEACEYLAGLRMVNDYSTCLDTCVQVWRKAGESKSGVGVRDSVFSARRKE